MAKDLVDWISASASEGLLSLRPFTCEVARRRSRGMRGRTWCVRRGATAGRCRASRCGALVPWLHDVFIAMDSEWLLQRQQIRHLEPWESWWRASLSGLFA